MPYLPALNEITRQALDKAPIYTDNPDERKYIILFPEDYDAHGRDMAGNVALLVDKDQAEEIRDLAQEVIDDLR